MHPFNPDCQLLAVHTACIHREEKELRREEKEMEKEAKRWGSLSG
jgi:hypothetical protein